MKEGPDITQVAAMMGDPARNQMLMAMMSGMALTGTELAREAGITASTASGHLSKLETCGLVNSVKQGRCRYYRIADPDVAQALEALTSVAARVGHLRTRPGPRDSAMREARSCYDHLAGRHAVSLFEHWVDHRVLSLQKSNIALTSKGTRFFDHLGIELEPLLAKKRPLCRTCIDWSERRNHLGGSLGAAILSKVLEQSWATREAQSRVVDFSADGLSAFSKWYTGDV